MWCSCYSCCSSVEKFLGGYRPEHIFLGLQVAVGIVISMLPLTVNNFWKAMQGHSPCGTSTIWTLVTLVIVMEPNMGGALTKGMQRALGGAIGGGLGIAILAIADKISPGFYDGHEWHVGPVAVALMCFLGFLITVHKQRFKKLDHFFFVMLYSMPVIVGTGIRDGTFKADYAAWRIINIELGVGLATLVSVVVFPIRARWLLEREVASMLIRVGDLAVWTLSQVLLPPNADLTMPGTTYTDKDMSYGDDGVERKLEPLQSQTHALSLGLAELSELLQAADKEWYMFKKPRLFPTKKYSSLLRSCHVMLALVLSLLYWLQSTVVNLQLVQAHSEEVRELGVQLSSSLTALSWIIRPPKSLKKGRRKQKAGCGGCGGSSKGGSKGEGGRGGSGNEGGGDPAGAATAVAPSVSIKGLIEGQQEAGLSKEGDAAAIPSERASTGTSTGGDLPGGGGPSLGAAWLQPPAAARGLGGEQPGPSIDVEAAQGVVEDDPFAALAESQQRGSGSWEAMKLRLSQQLSRSRSHSRRQQQPAAAEEQQRGQALGSGGEAAAPAAIGPAANGTGAGSGPAEAVATVAAVQAGKGRGPECNAGPAVPARCSCAAEEGREEGEQQGAGALALQKLIAMAEAAARLVEVVALEREASGHWVHPVMAPIEAFAGAGVQQAAALDTLGVVVNTGTGMARQVAAMFTALDPGRARLLHDKVKAAVQQITRLEGKLQEHRSMGRVSMHSVQ